MNKRYLRLISLLLLTVILTGALASCSKPPELETVRETFIDLIEASAEVNEIFFGNGLPTYPRVNGSGDLLYHEESKTYYSVIEDGEKTVIKYKLETGEWAYALKTKDAANEDPLYTSDGYFYYPIDYKEEEVEYVYDENSPGNYDYVRIDCKYQSVEAIMELAESVYSQAYLKGDNWEEGDLAYGGVYSAMFDGIALGSQISYARYKADDTMDGFFLLKSNEFEPFFEEQKTYDFSTMKIVSPSRANLVNVEITACGRYIDFESFEVRTGEHKVTLTFILQDGEWRLDTPTY